MHADMLQQSKPNGFPMISRIYLVIYTGWLVARMAFGCFRTLTDM